MRSSLHDADVVRWTRPPVAFLFVSALVGCLSGTRPAEPADPAHAARSNHASHDSREPAARKEATLVNASVESRETLDPKAPAGEAHGARDPEATKAEVPEKPRLELPRGGREIFPRYRLVGFCGTPGAPALGKLAGDLAARAKSIESYAAKYASGREAMPVFELISVVVQGAPGKDQKYRRRVPTKVIDDYLKAARAAKAILLLNIQPGHSDFMTEVKEYERYLREPDVGIAMDPEWAMKPKQTPGVYYGQTTGAIINDVASYLSKIVEEHDLPEKVLVFHQMNAYIVKNEADITAHPGVAIIKSVDGLGPQGAKINTYKSLVKNLNPVVHAGFKLFFDEDTRGGSKIMSPERVLSLVPEPEYVMYE